MNTQLGHLKRFAISQGIFRWRKLYEVRTMYISPNNVTAPKAQWLLFKVLIDNGPDTASYALGSWDDRRCIATRWNGNDSNEVGWPRVYVHPCWQVLGDELFDAVIALIDGYEQKVEAMLFLAGLIQH